ncbi:microcin C ABC transporter permease YejB [Siccirubricoccus deserti]|uniref:Microcin C ABC transporter permease YejB n=1 Tax=Siccirubricoccus deserti TaxID=2013562 RepID=A0A9X0QXC2_9PROT|nr:microcin C ABC transporter permease YejB [Siccirubricoccus deserti]MBC4015007.1 microcin C ABC transporter permease YejB [Siccirubricoccus deserti]GGC36317.1 microcin C ABC transporter permease YejB [Siccirubricoccus deserti]
MGAYLLRRLLLVVPTLLGIILINFAVVQFAPGGPVEQMIAELKGSAGSTLGRISGEGQGETRTPQRGENTGGSGEGSRYRGAQGLDPAIVAEIEKAFGFDKPWQTRLGDMLAGYVRFDLGRSLFRDKPVVDLILEKMPVSVSLGLWSTLIIYLVSIPLGIRKAVRDGSRFDVATSAAVLVGYAIPGFLFAILLVVLFAGGSFLQIFPLRGLLSPGMEAASFWERALDYAWHMVLPTLALVIGGFAGLTMLTKNSFMEEIHKQYVVTARAKGAGEQRVLYGHVFRNAMLLIIAGFPAAFIGILFTGALLVEIIFSLDGLGLLGFEAAIRRDYPVMFGTLYIFTLLGLVMQIIGDFAYTLVDPRIDFEARR